MSATTSQLVPSSQQPAQLAALSGGTALTADPKTVIAQVRAVQEIMAAVMKEGVHYGKIPGTPESAPPSLFKPGSEVLLSAFKISVEPEVTATRDGNHITYEVHCVGRHIATGLVIGVGVGEASTAEEKYSWRAAVCREEFEATPVDKRRTKWNKGKRGYQGEPDKPAWSVDQVRTNPADLANTVLKMAKKRAQIDLCLTGLAASDIFTQDLEDLPAEYIDGATGEVHQQPTKPRANQRYRERAKTGAPSEGSTAAGSVSEGQVRLLKAKTGSDAKMTELLTKYSVDKVENFPKAKVNEALDWLSGKGDKGNE